MESYNKVVINLALICLLSKPP